MIPAVRELIKRKALFQPSDKLLVACSGGIDSITAVSALMEMGYRIGIAHCNFELRGKESDEDQEFVERYATEKGLPFFTINFNTEKFAKKGKISIQEAARFLRYTFLEDVRKLNGYKYIVTAHNFDDQAETVLQHIAKGTGLKGLQGIPYKNEHIVRPFLSVPRKDIAAYAKQHGIKWREDSSNATLKYDRNLIRHQWMPMLESFNPAIKETLFIFSERMREASALLDERIDQLLRKHTLISGATVSISIGFLKKHPAASTILYHWLQPAGFTAEQLPDILNSIYSEHTGQEFLTATHRLVRDRKRLYLFDKIAARQDMLLVAALKEQIHFNEYEIKMSMVPIAELNMKKSARYAYFDADKVSWPLKIRQWKEGDYFYPFGLGKRQNPEKAGKKKLSKYFKDEKLTALQKETLPVMLCGEKIIWLVGHRTDDRFKVTPATKVVLKMVITDGYEKG